MNKRATISAMLPWLAAGATTDATKAVESAAGGCTGAQPGALTVAQPHAAPTLPTYRDMPCRWVRRVRYGSACAGSE